MNLIKRGSQVMIPESVQEHLSDVLDNFDSDLRILHRQGVLTEFDVRKIKNQAEVTRDGMLETMRWPEFDERAQEKVLTALVRDFEKSIQRILDGVVARKGEIALITYRLNKADERIKSRSHALQLSPDAEQKMLVSMAVTRKFILESLSDEKRLFGKKLDVDQVVENYSSALMSFFEMPRITS